MQSCSVHHCVLFLLTLTFTTDPGSAAEFPIYATLHQSVTLPCGAQCSGRAKWTLDSNKDVVFAQCDQTSCRSLKDGFNMSYDKYKKGDLSLTITNPDYSMRKTYTCECDLSDYANVNLRISPVSSAVPVQTEGDLKLDLSVPEPVEVIYRSRDSADDVQICNVTQRSLQCKSEYTPRTSLSYPELTLRHMERSESGTYIIRNLDYKEDIRVYAVSVSGYTSGENAGIVIVVLLLLSGLLIAGVFMYRKIKKQREVKRLMEEVDELYRKYIYHLNEGKKEEAEKVKKTVLDKIDSLQSKHGEGDNPEGPVNMFCNFKRILLDARHFFFNPVESLNKEVNELLGRALLKSPVEMMDELQWMEKKINDLELKYSGDTVYSGHVTLFCKSKREDLRLCRMVFRPQVGDVQPVTGQVKSDIVAVTELVNETLHRAAVGEAELQKVEEKIKDLEQKYSGDSKHSDPVTSFCKSKRSYLRLYRDVFITRNTSLQPVTQQVKTVMNEVNKLIKEAESRPKGEREAVMQKVLQKINDEELKYSWTEEYYRDVTLFCGTKRSELKCCRVFYRPQNKITELQRQEVEKEMDAVDDLIKEVLQEKKELQDVEKKTYDLEVKYWDLGMYCINKRTELILCRKIYRTQKGSLQPGTGEEVKSDMEAVYEIIRQYKHRPTVEVEEKIDDLEQKCRENREYYRSVRLFWEQKRRDLELGSKLGLIELKFNSSNTEKEMEEVVKILKELKSIADQNHTINPAMVCIMYRLVSLSLKWINNSCREQRDHLNKFKQQPSRGETDDKMIRDVEKHLRDLEQWCIDKEYELNIYNGKLERGGGGGGSDVDPQTSRSNGGEGTPLLEVKTEQK